MRADEWLKSIGLWKDKQEKPLRTTTVKSRQVSSPVQTNRTIRKKGCGGCRRNITEEKK